MKKKSIDLLTKFFEEAFKDYNEYFSAQINAVDDYDNHWTFDVIIADAYDNSIVINLNFKVCYLDDTIWIDVHDTWEQVENDRWTIRHLWYMMYNNKY